MISTSRPIEYVDDLVNQFRLGIISLDEMWDRLNDFFNLEPDLRDDEIRDQRIFPINRISRYFEEIE